MNTEVVNILISIDKNVDKILKKYSTEAKNFISFSDTFPKSSKNLKSAKNLSKVPLSSVQQDRRERRTLRAKVNSILNDLPKVCKSLGKKEKKTMLDSKKKKLNAVNQIREKLFKEPLYPDDISLDTSFDVYGNIKPKLKEIWIPLTPRSALRSKLTAAELEMLKEDPVYFIQNEKFKYKIKLDEDENWERLLDGEIQKKPKSPEKKSGRSSKNPKKLKNFKNPELEFHKIEDFSGGLENIVKKNKSKSISEGKIQVQMQGNKMIGSDFKVESKKKNSKKNEQIEKYYKRLAEIQKMQEKQREVEEKIMKFEKQAKGAEEKYLNRIKDRALKARMGLGREKMGSFSRQTVETFVEKGKFK